MLANIFRLFFFFPNMLVPIANRANMLTNILTNNIGSNVGQHVGTVCEGLEHLFEEDIECEISKFCLRPVLMVKYWVSSP